MAGVAPRRRPWLALLLVGALALVVLGLVVFREDIQRTRLDPKIPFQTYSPPPAPDYAKPGAWALLPARPREVQPGDPAADVFLLSPTLYDGGRHWNAPIDDPESDRLFRRVVAPNYAGPFVRVGRIFAPRYRQASLYTQVTLREDAREARRFAYGDVAAAFRFYLAHYDRGRPLIVVGVEQGGLLASRLLSEVVAQDPALRARLAAAYLMETAVPAHNAPLPPCVRRAQTGCVAAWVSAPEDDPVRARHALDRALVWNAAGDLANLTGPALCFNPILGAATEAAAPPRLHLGAANATGLEWGARPAFMARQVSAHCQGGVLRTSPPKSASLKPARGWKARARAPGYNLFYADIEADAAQRVAALSPRGASLPASSRTRPAAP